MRTGKCQRDSTELRQVSIREVVIGPVEVARSKAPDERATRNSDLLQSHLSAVRH